VRSTDDPGSSERTDFVLHAKGEQHMKRLLVLPVLAAGALALAAFAFASAGSANKHAPTAKGGKLTFSVTTTDHGCNFRPWATDTLKRTYKVHLRKDGSYTVRREDKGRFVTTGGQSPSADPCPGVVRRGKHGATVVAGIKGKLHGYLQGTVTGGTFIPTGTCTATCSADDFIANFFTSGASFTCSQGYAGCRFNFSYTAQRQQKQGLLYHHWVDRGLDGVHEIFIGDIASA
jgi:type 1 fimbria pilin